MARLGHDWPAGRYSGWCEACGLCYGGDKRDPLCVQCAIAAHVAAAVAARDEAWVKAANARRDGQPAFLWSVEYLLGYRDALGELLEDMTDTATPTVEARHGDD